MITTAKIDRPTFERFRRLIYEKSGIALSDNKEALLTARIRKRLDHLGLDSFRKYYQFVKNGEENGELSELLNAISTNTTYFFREESHFELLGKIMRQWEMEGQTRFRLWCAASSSGEEPYTIAITLKEVLKTTSDTKLLATDIDSNMLKMARNGIYDASRVDRTPRHLLSKYFDRRNGSNARITYKISNELRRMITFGSINLAKPPFPLKGPLDVIMCRNVMIYFDTTVRKRLLSDFHRLLKPGGYLIVGHAESLSGMLCEMKTVKPSVYMKKQQNTKY